MYLSGKRKEYRYGKVREASQLHTQPEYEPLLFPLYLIKALYHGVPKSGVYLLADLWPGSIVLLNNFDTNLYYEHFHRPLGYFVNRY